MAHDDEIAVFNDSVLRLESIERSVGADPQYEVEDAGTRFSDANGNAIDSSDLHWLMAAARMLLDVERKRLSR